MKKVAIIVCNGSGASVTYGPKDGRDGIRLSHIVDDVMKKRKFPPKNYEHMPYECNSSYWPSSLIRVKRAIKEALAQGCTKLVLIGFSKGAIRIFDAVNWMQRQADKGRSRYKTALQNTGVFMLDYQRTIFNKHKARPRVLKGAPRWLRYIRQEGSRENPKVKRTMNGYPMILPRGLETVITQSGYWHNNIRHHPTVRQEVLDLLRWAFGKQEV